MLKFEDALAQLLAAAQPLTAVETLDTAAAHGRVLAQDLVSPLDVPPLDNSAVDGYALRVGEVGAAGIRLPVSQRIPAGSVGTPLTPGSAARIFTGAPVPPGADAVVMQELCSHEGDGVIINHLPKLGENIRRAGEDVARGGPLLAAGSRLRPQDLAFAASVGLAQMPVFRPLRVAVFFTGDELRMPGEPLVPGTIYNTNRFALVALLQRLGCVVQDLGQVADDLEATRAALRRGAAESDVILTSGGVSVGEEDHVKAAVRAEGRLDLWQIGIKPGKPLAFGQVRRPGGGEVDFIGLPGNPVSAFVTFLVLVRPFLLRRQGATRVTPVAYRLLAADSWLKGDRRREFLRATLNQDGAVAIYPHQGSGVMASNVHGDGLLDVPPQTLVQRGDWVRFLPFSELLN